MRMLYISTSALLFVAAEYSHSGSVAVLAEKVGIKGITAMSLDLRCQLQAAILYQNNVETNKVRHICPHSLHTCSSRRGNSCPWPPPAHFPYSPPPAQSVLNRWHTEARISWNKAEHFVR